MHARAYVIPISHPAGAAVGMLRHKRIPHRVVSLALEIDGDTVQSGVRGLSGAQLSEGSAGIVAIRR